MFPQSKEIVSVVFRQVLSKYVGEKNSNATKALVHADVASVLNTLFGDFVDQVVITLDSFEAEVEVHFNAEDPYIVYVKYDWLDETYAEGYA